MLVLFLKLSELPHNAEHDFAGAASLGVGDGELGRHIRVEVMVDEHDDTWRPEQGGLHLVDTTRRVEVEAEHKVGNLQEQIALLGVLVVADDLLCIGQPMEEVRELIGHNDRGLLAHAAEELCPSEAGTDGIAVRTAMAGDDDVLTGFNQCTESAALLWRKNVDIHSEQLVRINALVDELLDAGYRTLAVGGVCNAKPL